MMIAIDPITSIQMHTRSRFLCYLKGALIGIIGESGMVKTVRNV